MKCTVLLLLVIVCGFAIVESTRFYLYSCPICFERRKRDIHYGFRHTYIQIGEWCYDWGDWGYTRGMRCSDPEMACCVRRRSERRTGETSCANRIREFENRWRARGRSYDLLFWNCQRYSNRLKDFLESCDLASVSF